MIRQAEQSRTPCLASRRRTPKRPYAEADASGPRRIEQRMADQDNSAKGPQRSPILLIVLLIIIILGIASFLILRPRGTGASTDTSPASSR